MNEKSDIELFQRLDRIKKLLDEVQTDDLSNEYFEQLFQELKTISVEWEKAIDDLKDKQTEYQKIIDEAKQFKQILFELILKEHKPSWFMRAKYWITNRIKILRYRK